MKVLEGGKKDAARRCPAPYCGRTVRPGQRHKNKPGGSWCDGIADPLYDRAMDLLVRVHDAATTMATEKRYVELIALLSPIERKLGWRAR